ncbi:unnamed protein product [Parascedosporium putredinis]|uniref:Uncharacterized protein n=1 Tax=Parascedosporium putredinis TaxID=1442378 RepID=A0A9P1H2B1_9PEZI|nr:unnamed protein product [Parascedosporium putredinis]CAI7994779.1 unnamed protein product [Parascedosporium putredinis]
MRFSNLIAATAGFFSYHVSALAPVDLSPRSLEAREYQISEFEKRFIDTIEWEHSNQTVKLSKPIIWGVPLHDKLHGDCHVVGRYQTDQVHGTEMNFIDNGIVYLREPAAPVRVYGEGQNILMYDFGWREGAHAHGHDDHGPSHGRMKREKKGGSCKQNHGGKTCSQVYKINHGRCRRDHSSCIDYNGWRPNCKNKSDKWAFPGSDCYTAVARGHCWNEIPN